METSGIVEGRNSLKVTLGLLLANSVPTSPPVSPSPFPLERVTVAAKRPDAPPRSKNKGPRTERGND